MRGPYRATAAKRAEIVQAAFEVFAAEGFEAASLRSIAARVGISHTGLLHHFSSKENLLAAVLTQREDDERALLPDTAVDTLDDLAELLATAVTRYTDSPALVKLWTGISISATHPDHPAHSFLVRRYARWTDELVSHLEHIKRQGGVACELDTGAVAAGLLALAQGLPLHRLADPELDISAAILQLCRRLAPR